MAQNLSNLPLGAKIKYGKHSVNGEVAQDIVWVIVAKNHQSTPAYPSNSVTLFTEKIIDKRFFDAPESGGQIDRRAFGNNRYSVSNIDQWLNKDGAAGLWYEATHTYDAVTDSDRGKPAFLHYFSTAEKNAILSTTIRTKLCSYDGGEYEDISRKVFLPSASELGVDYANEGTLWSYIATNPGAANTVVTNQFVTNQIVPDGGTAIQENYGAYWVRTNRDDITYYSRFFNNGWGHTHTNSSLGIRPAFNLPSTLSVSETTDADGCYTAVWNTAPSYPTTFNVPSTVYGGKTNNISWNKVSDPDGDTVTYILECAYDGGSFSQIYSGTATSYNHSVTYGKTSIQYRIKAVDTKGATSSYATSAVKTIVNNKPPVISGTDGNLGVKTNGFTQTYTITDADADSVTIVERIDGVQIRSYVATLGATNTFSVTGNTWLSQTNGSHLMTITASDSFGNSVVRTYTFTKTVTSFSIENTSPMSASTMPTRIALSVNRNIPPEADFKVEVCNNGFDASPAWENATSSVENSLVYVFKNTSKTSSNWGVRIRVTVNRNNADGACYITAIGGNFE